MVFLRSGIERFMNWNRDIRMFFLSNLLYQTGFGMFSVLYNLYVQSLGFSQAVNGRIVSLQSLATALMFLPIGFIGDRTSRKTLLLIGSLFTGIGFLGRSFAETESGFQFTALFSGLFAAVAQVTAVPFLADKTSKEERLHLLSLHFSVTLAAQILGSMGGGALADLLQWFGFGKKPALQLSLMTGSMATLASFLPLVFIRKDARSSGKTVPGEDARPAPVPAKEWKTIGRFTFAQLLVGIGSGLVVPYLNLYFADRFSVSLTSIGVLISLGQLMTILSMLIGPALVRKIGKVPAIAMFQLMSLPFLMVTGFTNLLWIAAVGFLFRQALMNAANPITSSILVDRVSSRRVGMANSLNQMAFMLGWAGMGNIQPKIISSYGTYWGYALTFSLTGLLYVSAAVFFYLMFRDKRPVTGTLTNPL